MNIKIPTSIELTSLQDQLQTLANRKVNFPAVSVKIILAVCAVAILVIGGMALVDTVETTWFNHKVDKIEPVIKEADKTELQAEANANADLSVVEDKKAEIKRNDERISHLDANLNSAHKATVDRRSDRDRVLSEPRGGDVKLSDLNRKLSNLAVR